MAQRPDDTPIYPIPSTDAGMRAAMEQARLTLPEFIREVEADARRIIPAMELAAVKAYFADTDKPEEGEHM